MTGIKVDGTIYDVRVTFDSLGRSFQIVEGRNSTKAISGRSIRDIIGTEYTYQMNVEPNPANPTDYDSFYEAITEPVESHIVEMPYGQTVLTFEAKIESGSDTYAGMIAGYNRWKGLKVNFVPMEPQVQE